MMREPFKMIRHAITMVGRTIKSYIMLSVTIVMSFSLLFGYLVYTDSTLYNKYKNVFSEDRNALSLYDYNLENEKIEMVLKQINELENTYHYIMYETSGYFAQTGDYILDDGRKLSASLFFVKCIPNRVWGLYDINNEQIEVTYLDGVEHEGIVLNAGEAIMDETTFHLLGLDKMEEPIYHLALHTTSGDYSEDEDTVVHIPIKIVATCESYVGDKNEILKQGRGESEVLLNYDRRLYLSLDDFSMEDYPEFYWQRRIYFYSQTPELVDQIVDRISYTSTLTFNGNSSMLVEDYAAAGVYQTQNEALEKMQTEARTKSIIAAALLLLLGINLYSSFTNALNDRKFEIGVKRAVGATSFEIIRQFLYESILVMMANIILSVALVIDIFVVYKFIYESIPNEWGYYSDWILYVSPYSIAMFAVCSVTLTVVFSLIFAYKSTQVEIVQYLKAE